MENWGVKIIGLLKGGCQSRGGVRLKKGGWEFLALASVLYGENNVEHKSFIKICWCWKTRRKSTSFTNLTCFIVYFLLFKKVIADYVAVWLPQ